jgi:hypothetical protein
MKAIDYSFDAPSLFLQVMELNALITEQVDIDHPDLDKELFLMKVEKRKAVMLGEYAKKWTDTLPNAKAIIMEAHIAELAIEEEIKAHLAADTDGNISVW